MWRALYRLLTWLAVPAIGTMLRRRVSRGREDPVRLDERRGVPSLVRPDGPLVWIHGASVGESQSVRPLITRLQQGRPDLNILLTTMTVSAARLWADNPMPGTLHQFLPLDHRPWVECFLDHWRPDMLVLVDTELWPNMIWCCSDRDIPLMLVNGRMSADSERRWHRAPGLIEDLLGRFALIHGQSPAEAERFQRLGAPASDYVGNLKFDAPPLPAADADLAILNARLGARPRWIAASTHPGEEEIVLDAHEKLVDRFPDLLTVIAPRHPDRGPTLAREIAARGISVARRALGEMPESTHGVYLVDTLGELGLFYRLCPITLIGGGFPGGPGGHNPIEPAMLGSAVLHGPDMHGFAWAVEILAAEHGALAVDAPYLPDALAGLLCHDDRRQALAENGTRAAGNGRGASKVLAGRILRMIAEDGNTASGGIKI